MADLGALGSYEAFVSAQLRLLGDALVAEHRRLLQLHAGRAESISGAPEAAPQVQELAGSTPLPSPRQHRPPEPSPRVEPPPPSPKHAPQAAGRPSLDSVAIRRSPQASASARASVNSVIAARTISSLAPSSRSSLLGSPVISRGSLLTSSPSHGSQQIQQQEQQQQLQQQLQLQLQLQRKDQERLEQEREGPHSARSSLSSDSEAEAPQQALPDFGSHRGSCQSLQLTLDPRQPRGSALLLQPMEPLGEEEELAPSPGPSPYGRLCKAGDLPLAFPRSPKGAPACLPPLESRPRMSALAVSPIPEEEEDRTPSQRSRLRRNSAPPLGSIKEDEYAHVRPGSLESLGGRTVVQLGSDQVRPATSGPEYAAGLDTARASIMSSAGPCLPGRRSTMLRRLGALPASILTERVERVSMRSSAAPFDDSFSSLDENLTSTTRSLLRKSSVEDYLGALCAVDTVFVPLPMWEEKPSTMTQGLRRGKAFLWCAMSQVTPLEEEENGRFGWLANIKVAEPNSQRRLIWDLLALAFLLHDAFFLPLAFLGVEDSAIVRNFAWCARIFWSLDMVASVCAGFEKVDGSFEGRLGPVARRYGKTWLVPDIVLVAASWTEVLVQIPRDQERVLYLFGLARMLRLVRLVRIRAALALLYAKLRSERLALLASILQSLSCVVVMVHVIACLWVGLGRINSDGWVAKAGLLEAGAWDCYAWAFHWSLTQIYGAMELTPSNITERFFAIGALLTGFFVATAFVSSVTSSMTRLHIISSQKYSHLLVLRKYLQESGISSRLACRVQLNAKHAIAEQQRNVEEADVEMLQLVSEPLRVELHLEVYSPVLGKHPLFGQLLDGNPAAMRQVCHVAVSTMSVSKDDVLFSRGEVPTSPKMLFLASGGLTYTQDGTHFQALVPGEWACEAVLWTSWVYHGLLQASVDSRIVMLDATLFQEIAGKSQTEELKLEPYVKQFVNMLNACTYERSDLGSSTDTESLVSLAYPRSTLQDGHTRNSRWRRMDPGWPARNSGLTEWPETLAPDFASISPSAANTPVSRPAWPLPGDCAKPLDPTASTVSQYRVNQVVPEE